MFEQSEEKIDSIRLILFYDANHKIKYEKIISDVINELFIKENKKFPSIIEFQCIYIKSPYLFCGFFNQKRELNKLIYELTRELKIIKNMIADLKSRREIQSLKSNKNEINDKVNMGNTKEIGDNDEIEENLKYKIENDNEYKKSNNDN